MIFGRFFDDFGVILGRFVGGFLDDFFKEPSKTYILKGHSKKTNVKKATATSSRKQPQAQAATNSHSHKHKQPQATTTNTKKKSLEQHA